VTSVNVSRKHYLRRAILIAQTIQESCDLTIQRKVPATVKNHNDVSLALAMKNAVLINHIFDKIMYRCDHLDSRQFEVYARPDSSLFADSLKELVKTAQNGRSSVNTTKDFPSVAKELSSILQRQDLIGFSLEQLKKQRKKKPIKN